MSAESSYCDVCGDDLWGGGSHYHCGRCRDPKPTSQYGHFTKFDDGRRGMTCDPANIGKTWGFNHRAVIEDQTRPAAQSDGVG